MMNGCAQTTKEPDKPAILNVKIDVKSPIALQKKTEIACIVTYGKEKVTNADEVKFEIWKQGNGQHEMLQAKHKGNGKYAVEKIFTEPGTYSIVAHVTAHNMHNMPKTDVVVGQPSEQAESGEHHEDHDDSLTVNLHEHIYEAGKPAELAARITHDGKPLVNVSVHFEIWKENAEKHEFIDAHENANGEYSATATFKEKGTYFVKVHVESKQLHEHKVEQVTVR
ncbi:FixH family protein [Anoxybacillus tepidamans]|uniref:FixH family protein n=1 Tax=Anoxybacteroides tepidamans TaxID=265948 RepID=UPI0006872BAD|nr:FixH family protein [Anoxybacillus tepidamans]